MSRGPGLWQRVILETFEAGAEAVPVSAVAYAVRGNPTRSDFVAVRRAARSLVESGRARAVYMTLPTHDESRMTPQLVVTRPDSELSGNVHVARTPGWVTPPASGCASLTLRQIAATMGVSPSTVSRDVRANAEAGRTP